MATANMLRRISRTGEAAVRVAIELIADRWLFQYGKRWDGISDPKIRGVHWLNREVRLSERMMVLTGFVFDDVEIWLGETIKTDTSMSGEEWGDWLRMLITTIKEN